MKVVELLFDNFARTQKLISLGLVDMVRFTDVYSDEEIRSIISDKNMDVDLSLLRDRKVGKYGVKIETSTSSPTARYANFTSVMDVAKMFPDRIPPEAVIENSNIINKEGLIDTIIPVEEAILTAQRKLKNKNEIEYESKRVDSRKEVVTDTDNGNVVEKEKIKSDGSHPLTAGARRVKVT